MRDDVGLLRDFVNTRDLERGVEQLGSPEELAAWLAGRGLVAPSVAAGDADLRAAVGFREGLRDLLAEPGEGGELDGILAQLALRVSCATGRPELVAATGGAAAGLARLAAAAVAAGVDGSWERLKICRNPSCRAAFIDGSKNRSRSWCSMQLCGNRTKARTFRARHRDAPPASRPPAAPRGAG